MPKPISIATWNVNSVRSRLPQLLEWLRSNHAPDILCLQELKVVTEEFPAMEIEELGYNLALNGQKTYNGVAILSKFPMEDVIKSLPGDNTDEQARYVEAVISVGKHVLRVASVYVPNGQEVGSDKFAYKMRFFDRLYAHMQNWKKLDEMQILAGDFNVAPYGIDVFDPVTLEGTVCFHPQEREKIRKILHLGYYDSYRTLHPASHQFSWWDYRGNGWKMNKGLRIDYLLLSPQATACLHESEVLHRMRDAEKASDHAPVVCTLTLPQSDKLFAA